MTFTFLLMIWWIISSLQYIFAHLKIIHLSFRIFFEFFYLLFIISLSYFIYKIHTTIKFLIHIQSFTFSCILPKKLVQNTRYRFSEVSGSLLGLYLGPWLADVLGSLWYLYLGPWLDEVSGYLYHTL